MSIRGIVTYKKPREELTENEKAGVDGLAANGISPTVMPEDPTAAANIDLVIDGEPWEMKNITNISSASNQVKRARIKWMKLGIETPMKAVFTTIGASIPFDDICDTLSRRRREGEQFIVLSEDQELRECRSGAVSRFVGLGVLRLQLNSTTKAPIWECRFGDGLPTNRWVTRRPHRGTIRG